MKLASLALLAASVAAQNIGSVDLGKYDKCLTSCLEQTAKSVSCELSKPECYCGTNNLNIATSTYALCISKDCESMDAQVMASGVYGQICSNVALGGKTDNQAVNSVPSADKPSSTASADATPSVSAATGASQSQSHAPSASKPASSPAAKPSGGATARGASVLAVGGALAAFLV